MPRATKRKRVVVEADSLPEALPPAVAAFNDTATRAVMTFDELIALPAEQVDDDHMVRALLAEPEADPEDAERKIAKISRYVDILHQTHATVYHLLGLIVVHVREYHTWRFHPEHPRDELEFWTNICHWDMATIDALFTLRSSSLPALLSGGLEPRLANEITRLEPDRVNVLNRLVSQSEREARRTLRSRRGQRDEIVNYDQPSVPSTALPPDAYAAVLEMIPVLVEGSNGDVAALTRESRGKAERRPIPMQLVPVLGPTGYHQFQGTFTWTSEDLEGLIDRSAFVSYRLRGEIVSLTQALAELTRLDSQPASQAVRGGSTGLVVVDADAPDVDEGDDSFQFEIAI